MPRPFLRARRFISDESWTKATTQDGTRYLGVFREYEPDLAAILTHQHVLVLGEPGAGKSMTAQAVLWRALDNGHEIPVPAALKSYRGNLRDLVDKNAPAIVLDDKTLTRTYILDGVDEIPREHRATFQQDIRDLIANDKYARLVLTSRQAFAAQHPDALPSELTTFHLLDFDDDDITAYQRCKPHAITLYILKKYGIENYFPQHACETVLKRDLARYFPIPAHKPIEGHFSEPQPRWRQILNRILRRPPRSFYQKRRNEEIAAHLNLADIAGTDLAEIIIELKKKAAQARQY